MADSTDRVYPLTQLRNLSYSSLLTLHSCPTKYLLRKCLPSGFMAEDLLDFSDQNIPAAAKIRRSNVTLAFGKAVGTGVQSLMAGKDDSEILMDMFLSWDHDYEDVDDRNKKSFGLAIAAVEKFRFLRTLDIDIADFELVKIPGTDEYAVELGFVISFPNGHKYRGFIDAVLRNKYTGEIIVLECKTTGAKFINAAKYKNSEQGLSYALVLDKIFGKLASYGVLYASYLTALQQWETFYFPKNADQRASWFRNTLTDIETLERYIAAQYFPRYGESCEAWGRPCEYIDVCHSDMSAYFIGPEQEAAIEAKEVGKYHVEISVLELLDAQLGE